jgi:hypothetical protein
VEGISAVQSSAGNRTVLSVKEFSQPSVSLSLCDVSDKVAALKELLQQYSGEEHSGTSVDPKTGNLHLTIPVVASRRAGPPFVEVRLCRVLQTNPLHRIAVILIKRKQITGRLH